MTGPSMTRQARLAHFKEVAKQVAVEQDLLKRKTKEKTERLRALRLAKEAADAETLANTPVRKRSAVRRRA